MSVEPLPPTALYHLCDPTQFPFQTTAEVADLTEIVGQRRALEAVHFGVGIRREGYNLFVMGPSGVGKHTLMRQHLGDKARQRPVPSDWCYVNNFDQPYKPRALHLPAGQGRTFRQDLEHLVDEAASALPATFEGDEYRAHKQGLEDELKERQEAAFSALGEEAARHDIKLFRTPSGFAFAPMKGDEMVGPDEFAKWDEAEQKRTEEVVSVLQERLQRTIQQIPQWRRETRDKITALDRETALSAVGHLVDDLGARYAALPEVVTYLKAVERDIVDNVKDFLKEEEGQEESDPRQLHRYKVNVMVDNGGREGVPVVYQDHPTYMNLVGRAEHIAQFGTLITDFSLIKPGALHEANGGYLIIDAHKLLTHPYAWDGLKRALYASEVRIESLEKMLSLVSTVALEPEPIPLEVKVVLVGDRELYYLLHEYDPDFAELFKVVADFDDRMERTGDNSLLYARLIATLCRKEQLRHFDREAVARVVEHGARLVEDKERLTVHVRAIADTLRESDYWAGEAGRETVTAADVQHAIDHHVFRLSRVREQLQEEVLRDTLYVDTSGERTGQINGLSVLSMGDYSFGQPSRITATVHIGEGHLVDIEREVELGGPIHSKGVLILAGFLSARYAQDHPLSLSASIVFEQNYGGVEGDSASLAELCSLLSAIAGDPIRQSLAMTGSVDQHGRVQPIGGVNEKIEGFFDICAARGLDGSHGVLIPAANVKHLMLRHDVVEAAAAGRFRVYPVSSVDEAMSLLTGLPAGERDDDGNYPPDSVNGRVQMRLTEMSLIRQIFADQAKEKGRGDGDDEGGVIRLDPPSG